MRAEQLVAYREKLAREIETWRALIDLSDDAALFGQWGYRKRDWVDVALVEARLS